MMTTDFEFEKRVRCKRPVFLLSLMGADSQAHRRNFFGLALHLFDIRVLLIGLCRCE